MPPAENVQQHLAGAWRMMTGRNDGLRMLDLSVDGFWNSFFAIVVALPALTVTWVTVANELAGADAFSFRLSVLARLAMVDLASWVLPIAVLAVAARPAGIAERFVPYVVASNWAQALIVWIMLPPSLLRLFWPDAQEPAAFASIVLVVVTLVLLWRLTNAAIDKGAGMATAVFFGMFAVSLAVLFSMQALLGLSMG